MRNFPKARSDDLVVIEVADQWVVQDAAGAEIAELDAQTAAIWRLADGATSVEAIAEALGTHREQVWAGLDKLYDWGLLNARVTPPAGASPLSRRGVLGTVARGAGWLGLAAAGAAAPAFADTEQSREQDSKRAHQRTMAAEEAEKKRHDRAGEQETKQRQHAGEEREKQTFRASEEKKKHPAPTIDQAAEQSHKRGGKPQ